MKKGYIINYTEKENNVVKSKSANVVASDMKSAIGTTGLVESEDLVIRNALLIKENIIAENENIEDATLAISIENDVDLTDTANYATPAIATAHKDDIIELEAICDKRYTFTGWFKGGVLISSNASINYTLLKGVNDLVAKFELKDIDITTSQSAGGECFCSVNKAKVGSSVKFLAVAEDGYMLDHFELNTESVGTDNPNTITIAPNDDMSIDVKAVFRTI